MSQPTALYRLQQIDTKLDDARKRARAIKNTLEGDTTVSQAREAAADLEQQLAPEQTRIKDLQLEMQTVDTQRQQLSDRLYGGAVSNPKELEDIQEKLDERSRRRDVLEERLLETMVKAETLQTALDEANARLKTAQKAWRAENKSLTQEFKQLKQAIQQLKVDREAALAQVQPDNRALYKELRKTKGGRAVARLDRQACSACRVDQTTVDVSKIRAGDGLVLCSSCGRILVAM